MLRNMLFKVLGLLILVCIPIIQARGVDLLTESQLLELKADIDKEVKLLNITCQNYDSVCEAQEETDNLNSPCRIIMRLYLCYGQNDAKGIQLIINKLMELPDSQWMQEEGFAEQFS